MTVDLGCAVVMQFVWVEALKMWVGKYEVTNDEYRRYKPEHNSGTFRGPWPYSTTEPKEERTWALNADREPVVRVNFDDMKEYAAWINRTRGDKIPPGYRVRLPSEAEFMTYAQCGDGRKYPWGNELPPKYGNYHGQEGASTWLKVDGYNDGYPVVCPVEQSGKNDWGLYGVGGNVYEACATDSDGASFGAWRGSCWRAHGAAQVDLLCTDRIANGGTGRGYGNGFRLLIADAGDMRNGRAQEIRQGLVAQVPLLRVNGTLEVATTSAPKLDGVLDDACWKVCDKAEHFSLNTGTGLPTQQTFAYICRDAHNLYIAFECKEDRLDKLVAKCAQDGGIVWHDDCVEIFIDTTHDHKTYYHFMANCIGSKTAGKEMKDYNKCEVKTGRTADAWTIEISIPWSILEFNPKAGDIIALNLCRQRKTVAENHCWSCTFGGFHTPAKFGHATFSGRKVYLSDLTVRNTGAEEEKALVKVKCVNQATKQETGRDIPVTVGAKKEQQLDISGFVKDAEEGVHVVTLTLMDASGKTALAEEAFQFKSKRAYAQEIRPGLVVDRQGGLLPCEELPGEALSTERPDPLIVPRADGGVTALIFYPREIVFLDLTNGKVKRQALPEKFEGPWEQLWGPDGRLYFGLWAPATMLRYDPVKDRIDEFGIIEPENQHVPIMTVGTDNKVYGLAGTKGHVFSIDPATDAIERYGRQGPERKYNIAYIGSLGVDDEWIYSTFGNVPAETRTLAMNKKTRAIVELKEIAGMRIQQQRDGVVAGGYWLYQGQSIPIRSKDERPPWPKLDRPAWKSPPKLEGKVELTQDLKDSEGNTEVRYRLDPKAEWKTLTYKMKPGRGFIRTVGVLPDGRVFGVGGYEGIFTFDPKTKDFKHLGLVPISNYDLQILGSQVYFASYPGGNGLFLWDAALPWTVRKPTPQGGLLPWWTDPGSNPQQLQRFDAPRGFQHPWFMVLGPSNTLYVAMHGERQQVGGIISWRELDTGKGGFLRKGFELYEPHGLCTALNGTKLVYSTTAVKGVNNEPRPESGRLFVIDFATREVEWFIDPIEGVDSTGLVIETKPGKLLLATDHRTDYDRDRWKAKFHGSTLCEVDMATRRVTRRVEFAGQIAGRRAYYMLTPFEKGPDGLIYTFFDEALARIDPETLVVTRLSSVDAKRQPDDTTPDALNAAKIGKLAFSGKDIYISGTSHFRRVANVLGSASGE
jgi:hypothetical protein